MVLDLNSNLGYATLSTSPLLLLGLLHPQSDMKSVFRHSNRTLICAQVSPTSLHISELEIEKQYGLRGLKSYIRREHYTGSATLFTRLPFVSLFRPHRCDPKRSIHIMI